MCTQYQDAHFVAGKMYRVQQEYIFNCWIDKFVTVSITEPLGLLKAFINYLDS